MIVTVIVAFAIFILYRSITLAQRAQKGVVNQMSRLKIELDKQRKEAERRQKLLEKALAKATKNL
ncbi:MAG: hypothetical protein HY831_00230 [Candidatus Aenigmarchaeota archaeon]|nr:hypothetical protein [Candidatus Aenigmarchaeota archaeon]